MVGANACLQAVECISNISQSHAQATIGMDDHTGWVRSHNDVLWNVREDHSEAKNWTDIGKHLKDVLGMDQSKKRTWAQRLLLARILRDMGGDMLQWGIWLREAWVAVGWRRETKSKLAIPDVPQHEIVYHVWLKVVL